MIVAFDVRRRILSHVGSFQHLAGIWFCNDSGLGLTLENFIESKSFRFRVFWENFQNQRASGSVYLKTFKELSKNSSFINDNDNGISFHFFENHNE
jgi:hypothetical protein